jgi:outer membrane protein assembly factor BamB
MIWLTAGTLLYLVGPGQASSGADWPMWRYDASHSAASPHALPAQLHLQWTRALPTPAPAWPKEQYKLQFDRSYEPVVMGQQIFVPSMLQDSVTAYDTNTGQENWKFFCEGPVRFAPIAWRDKVYAVSDDGCLYCLDALQGRLIWRFQIAPSERKVLGNGRLISAWPARGGPVLSEGTIYCTAGIWPFMGIFLCAVDADTGTLVWENSGSGSTYTTQQHGSPAFAGFAPQGYIAASDERLWLASRTVPACCSQKDGSLLYYHLADRDLGKYAGGYDVALWKDWFFNNGVAYRASDGKGLSRTSIQVMGQDSVFTVDAKDNVVAYTLKEVKDEKSKKPRMTLAADSLWKLETDLGPSKLHLKAGGRLYCSAKDRVAAIDIPTQDHPAEISWRHRIKGDVWRMLAADEKLFVVTEQGLLYCFGEKKVKPQHFSDSEEPLKKASKPVQRRARQILRQSRQRKGYCLWLGLGNRQLLHEVLRESELHVIVVEPNRDRVSVLRRELEQAGEYGSRVSVVTGDMAHASIPPYIASLIVVQDPKTAGIVGQDSVVERLCRAMRPYSGVAWLQVSKDRQLALAGQIAAAQVTGFRTESQENALLLRRVGPVPGSGNWTHQYGDVANTGCSQDQLKLPLGILWFGDDASFGDVLPRHGHGPPEQIAAGRLFIQGVDSISARDVYTGKTLWKRVLKGLDTFGVFYDKSYKQNYMDLSYNQQHIPGASVRGTNFVVTDDHLYVIQGIQCHVLDASSGQTVTVFSLPQQHGLTPKEWAYIGVYEKYLIAGADFVQQTELLDKQKSKKELGKWSTLIDKNASQRLVVMNRYTGQVLWCIQAQHGFLHNTIIAGKGRLFCLDRTAPHILKYAKDRSVRNSHNARLLGLDIETGEIIWQNTETVFGTWLSYSAEHDRLLQAFRKSRDMFWEPGDRMATHEAATGQVIWDEPHKYSGPCILHHNTIITQTTAYDLFTGQQWTRPHPLTGEPVPWQYTRNYGCGSVTASENFLTFRSAAAGYFDLAGDGGTGNFGGFRAGCTSNLIAANGVLNAPDYTSTCTCSYQNQTSLALIHMPEVETWTFSKVKSSKASIAQVGINFGAPGDRQAANGTLWLDYPSQGGSSPDPNITILPQSVQWFRKHTARITDGPLKWVEASGVRGARTIQVKVTNPASASSGPIDPVQCEPADSQSRRYTVHLHFMEPECQKPGLRVFTVGLQGQTVLKELDILAETQSPNIGMTKTFSGIAIKDTLTVSLTPITPAHETIICGIKIVLDESATQPAQ